MADTINVIARAISNSISPLPKFVIENHPKFVDFLRAYYKWSATEGPDLIFETMKLSNDIDLVVDELLDGYKQTYAKHFPKELKTDFRHFAKFLKEFYQLKGSPESFRIFFQAVFNENATVYFPNVQIFKPSEAVWNKDTYLKVEAVDGNPFDLINTEIMGRNNGYSALVSNVYKVGEYYDVYFEEAEGEFEIGEELISGDVKVAIIPIFKIKSFVSGQTWSDGSVIVADDVILKVDRINYGSIVSLNLISGGTGYEVNDVIETRTDYQGMGFVAHVATVNGSGAILSINHSRTGFGFDNEDVDFEVISKNGTGAVIEPVFDNQFRKIKSLSFITNAPYTEVGDLVVDVGGGTTVTFEPGVTNTVKYWIKSQSAVSTHHTKIHDSDYFQEFSYEVQSRADVNEFETSLKTLLHISGLKMFTKNIMQNDVSVDVTAELLFD